MDERIASALAVAFPNRAINAVTSSDGEWSDTSRTRQVTFADGQRAYLTIADSKSILRERAALTYVNTNCEIAVPEVLAADANSDPAYLATTPLDGATVADVWDRIDRTEQSQIVRSVGSALAALHTCCFVDHGWILDGNTKELVVNAEPWPEVLVDVIERLWDSATTDRFDWYFDKVVDSIKTNRDCLSGAPSALLHGDPAQPNCVWTDDGIGFVDWEASLFGDPAWELYRARCQLAGMPMGDGPEWLVESLHEGYCERVGGIPDSYNNCAQIYKAVQFTLTAGHADKTASFLDKPDRKFLNWVEKEAHQRLTKL
jgi:aminoglycoside phosphotransferase